MTARCRRCAGAVVAFRSVSRIWCRRCVTVILTALPGMVKALLMPGKLARPGNACMMINALWARSRFFGPAAPPGPPRAFLSTDCPRNSQNSRYSRQDVSRAFGNGISRITRISRMVSRNGSGLPARRTPRWSRKGPKSSWEPVSGQPLRYSTTRYSMISISRWPTKHKGTCPQKPRNSQKSRRSSPPTVPWSNYADFADFADSFQESIPGRLPGRGVPTRSGIRFNVEGNIFAHRDK